MKALLIKDWKLLKNQKQFFLITGVVVLMFLIASYNQAFVVSYATIMYTVFTISTISYDEYQNGLTFLFTLPVNRREYVIEKYCFGIGLGVVTASVVLAASVVISGIRGSGSETADVFAAALTSIILAAMGLSFTIPIQLKFGAEKGRMALMAVMMAVFVIIFGGLTLAKRLGWPVKEYFQRLDAVPPGVMAGVLLTVCAAALVISAGISISFLKNREF